MATTEGPSHLGQTQTTGSDVVSSNPSNVAPVTEITQDTDLASLTPAQLHELTQNFLDENAPDRPLIGEIVPLSVLRAEYESGSRSFVQQIDWLYKAGFRGVRRTRGDGDCFYRSLAFSYVERILQATDQPLAVASAVSLLDATLSMLEQAGFQRLVFEDFYDCFVSLIQQIVTPDEKGATLTPAMLLEAFQSPEVSNSVVVYLRLLTSAQIRADPDAFAPFLFHPELGIPMEPREFCENFVEAVGKEADHVQMTALSQALRIDVNVAYLDGRSGEDGKVDFVEFQNGARGGAGDHGTNPIVLLYRPGHYDILDLRSED